jgi:hypothetical protein
MHFIKYQDSYVLFDDFADDDHLHISFFDKEGNLLNKAAIEYRKNKYFNIGYTQLSIIKDELFFVMPVDYHLYGVNGDQIVAKYLFDFKKHNIHKDFRMNNINNTDFLSEIIDQGNENRVTFINGITQCNNWLASKIDAGNNSGTILYSFDEDRFYTLGRMGIVFYCLDEMINTDGQYFILTLQAHYYDTFKNYMEQGGSRVRYLEQILNFNLDVEDNPVICYIKLK